MHPHGGWVDVCVQVFQIHTAKMSLMPDVDLEEFIMTKDELSGADIKARGGDGGVIAC
jgi:26S proteasome regulatory subunit T2